MNNFLKNNWFKIILVCIIIIILFFLFLFVSSHNKNETLSNNIKCQQEGFQIYKTVSDSSKDNLTYGNPEFKFSKELNTCLYKGVEISKGKENSYYFYFIKDVYSNKQLVGYGILNDYLDDSKDTDFSENSNYKEYKIFEAKYFK